MYFRREEICFSMTDRLIVQTNAGSFYKQKQWTVLKERFFFSYLFNHFLPESARTNRVFANNTNLTFLYKIDIKGL